MEKTQEELAAAAAAAAAADVAEAKDQNHLLKGKRTKRQRLQSPIPFSIAANSLYNVEGGDDEEQTDAKLASPASSASNQQRVSAMGRQEEEEDEDMANCLILLAQGPSFIQEPHQEIQERNNKYYLYLSNNATQKFTSRKFLETSSNGHGGKAGYYVYQCKTCDRTFPSFQALGGHRASHKKPKAAHVEEKKTAHVVDSDEEDRVSLQLMYRSTNDNSSNNNHNITHFHPNKGGNNNYNKVHECGICGAEFTSGQALGGHMRRHRGSATSANMALPLSGQPMVTVVDQTYHQQPTKIDHRSRNTLSLDLDLNLPAPEDEHRRPEIEKLGSTPKQQQEQQEQRQKQQASPQMVFSAAPTLVDCHY